MSAPLPANINLLVPIGTLLGWSAAPTMPTASASSAGLKRAPSSRPPPTTPEPGGAPPSSTLTAPPPPTPAPRGQHPWTPATPQPNHPRPRHPAPPPGPPPQDTSPSRSPRRDPTRPPRRAPRGAQPRARPVARDQCDHRPPRPATPPAANSSTCCAPAPNVRRARLQRPGRLLRSGPHHPLAGRPNRPVQPRTEVQTPPSLQTSPRLARRTTSARNHPLDPPQRAHPPTTPTVYDL